MDIKKCLYCKQGKTLYFCNDCYRHLEGLMLVKVMEGSPNYQILNAIQSLKWDIEDKLNR